MNYDGILKSLKVALPDDYYSTKKQEGKKKELERALWRREKK